MFKGWVEGRAVAETVLEAQGDASAQQLADTGHAVLELDSVLASLIACQDTRTLEACLVELLLDRTSAHSVYVAVLDESGKFMEVTTARGSIAQRQFGRRFEVAQAVLGGAWHNASVDNKTITDPPWLESEEEGQVFALPLTVDDAVVAVVGLLSASGSQDFASEVPLVRRIGRVASIAMANTRLLDSTRQSLANTRALADLGQILSASKTTDEACTTAFDMLSSTLQLWRITFHLANARGELEPHVCWCADNGGERGTHFLDKATLKQSIAQWTFDTNRSAFLSRMDEDPRQDPAIHAMRKRLGIGSAVSVPMRKQGTVFGVAVMVRRRETQDFDESEVALFKSVVSQLSVFAEKQDLSEKLAHEAFHDPLTDLANRALLKRELEQGIEGRDALEHTFSVMYIDLDGFKPVNDTHGHAIGDRLLKMVAQRLKVTLSNDDLLARIGGDEFAVVVRQRASEADIAARILACLSTPFDTGSASVTIGASIGVSRFPEHSSTVDGLLACADEAMYAAKNSGKNCMRVFEDQSVQSSPDQVQLLMDLSVAIDKEQLELVYQPQVRFSDGAVIGVEALIRWQHPERGVLLPAEFLPLANESGVIDQIGRWVLEEAMSQLARWRSTPQKDLRISINVATSDIQRGDFSDQVLSALSRHGVPGHLVELELTESIKLYEIDSLVRQLSILRASGVRIAIDGFGAGYSSLSSLQTMPLDVLKFDRSFIKQLDNNGDEPSIGKTLLLVASGLGLETVTTGVELAEQADLMAGLECDRVQGFLFSGPVTADKLDSVSARIKKRLRDRVQKNRAA